MVFRALVKWGDMDEPVVTGGRCRATAAIFVIIAPRRRAPTVKIVTRRFLCGAMAIRSMSRGLTNQVASRNSIVDIPS